MRDMKKKVNAMEKMIITNKEHIAENKSMLTASQDTISRLSAKMNETKNEFLNKVDFTHQELNQQAELNHKWTVEQVEQIHKMLQSDKSDVKKEINMTNEVFKKQLFEQVDNLKNYVGRIDATAATHREEMQDKYNEKLQKIKDVCAQYFSKYEKHLLH